MVARHAPLEQRLRNLAADLSNAATTPQVLIPLATELRHAAAALADPTVIPDTDDNLTTGPAACAALLADLVDIASCSGNRPGMAHDILQFAVEGVLRLTRALHGQVVEGEFTLLRAEAVAHWGDYLVLLEEPSAPPTPEADDWGQAFDLDPAEMTDEGLSEDDSAPQLDVARLLAALQECSTPLSEDEDEPDFPAPAAATQSAASKRPAGPPVPPPLAQVQLEPDFLAAYLDDATRGLASLERLVLGLEAAPGDPAALRQIGRELHTLKGASASIGLDQIGHYLHEVEDYIATPGGARDIPALLQCVDLLRSQVDYFSGATVPETPRVLPTVYPEVTAEPRRTEPPRAEPARSTQKPTAPVKAESPCPAPVRPEPLRSTSAATANVAVMPPATSTLVPTPPAVINPSAASVPVPAVPEESLRVKTSRLDRLMDLLADLVVLRNRRDTQVSSLRKLHAELTRVTGRIRYFAEGNGLTRAEGNGLTRADGNGLARAVNGHHPGSNGTVRTAIDGEESGRGSGRYQSSSLSEIANDVSGFSRGLRETLESLAAENRTISEFVRDFRQELVELRRLPASGLFQRLQRAISDAARAEGKLVQVTTEGEESGIDRALQERLYEPLLHVVRNAVSHGIEPAAVRRQGGKEEAGTVTLAAYGDSATLVIEVRDNGGGLDYDAIRQRGLEKGLLDPTRPATQAELSLLIFRPGFSTRQETSEISGRGVGMDVVASFLDRLHGKIEVESVRGRGTTMRFLIPLRSAIEQVLVVRAAGRLFALPMRCVQGACAPQGGASEPRRTLAPVRLRTLLGIEGNAPFQERTVLLGQRRPMPGMARTDAAAILVDDILGPEEVVVRSLPPLLKQHPLCSGMTLSGSGETVLLLDAGRLFARYEAARDHGAAPVPATTPAAPALAAARPHVLVVDDSLSARRTVALLLKRWDVEVTEAADGNEALEKLRSQPFQLVVTDLEMPGLDGMGLLAEIHQSPRLRQIQTVIVSSCRTPQLVEQARTLGAIDYIEKPATERIINELASRLKLTRLAPPAPS